MLRAFQDHYPDIAAGVFVDETALVMGQVQIGSGSSVWPMAVLRGDVNRITVGAKPFVYGQDNQGASNAYYRCQTI